MATSRTRRRSTRGRSSVFNPSPQRYLRRPSAASSVSPAMSSTVSRPSMLGPNVESALAPQVEAFAPPGPVFDELPPVDVEQDFGGGDFGGGSDLADAILGAGQFADTGEVPLAAATDFSSGAAGPGGGPAPGYGALAPEFPTGAFSPPEYGPGPAPGYGALAPSLPPPPPPQPPSQLADALTALQRRRLEGYR